MKPIFSDWKLPMILGTLTCAVTLYLYVEVFRGTLWSIPIMLLCIGGAGLVVVGETILEHGAVSKGRFLKSLWQGIGYAVAGSILWSLVAWVIKVMS